MQKAMRDAASQAVIRMMLSSQNVVSLNQFLVLNVTRDHLVEDAIRELSHVDPHDLKKPLRVKLITYNCIDYCVPITCILLDYRSNFVGKKLKMLVE